MGIAITSLGARLGVAVETTAGTRPTTGYAWVSDVKSLPDLNQAPSNLETTDLSQTKNKTYTHGLVDGGTFEFGANITKELKTQWKGIVEAYNTAIKTGKATWFEIYFPEFDEAEYFTGEPLDIFTNGVETDSVVETTLRVNPTGDVVWETPVKPE